MLFHYVMIAMLGSEDTTKNTLRGTNIDLRNSGHEENKSMKGILDILYHRLIFR